VIIQPKVGDVSTLDFIETVRTNSNRQVYVKFMDDDGNDIDIVEEYTSAGAPKGELELQVTTIEGTILYEESYFPPSVPDIASRRIIHPITGKYQIKWGTGDYETSSARTLLFNWHVRKDLDSDDYYRTQVVEVISPRTLALLPTFRLMLDKSIKVIDPEDYCTLGYSTGQLITYLQLGLSMINAAQPYVAFASLDQFPLDRGLSILMRSALCEGLLSQLIFSIDCDTPAFNVEGHSFILTHAPIIKSLRDSLVNELSKSIQAFKLHYVTSGSIGIEFRISFAFYQTIMAAPPGTTFRNAISVAP